ncbi:MAG: LuxR C-terminal-related transcriptional regulator [Chloroflexota bacterium]
MLSAFPPQPTSFIGREEELTRLLTLLEQPDYRLITILGPGGVGKTRLAFTCAESFSQQNDLSIIKITLDVAQSREQLSVGIANAVGCNCYGDEDVETQLLAWMRDKRFLLLIDSFEHAQDGASLMVKLLNSVPESRFLVTSRERLGLRGENVFALKGFNIASWQSAEEAALAPAARLFLNSARRASADFELRDANLGQISRICRFVEGLPLAIELAAAWVDTLSVKEIADEIEASYTFLSSDFQDLPERQRSMMATFESSWNRLSPDKQDSLMRMSVFRGGFTRAAALAVTGANIQILQALVNKSMLKYSEDERYSIHELLRQYLAEKLAERGQTSAVETAHSRYFIDWLHGLDFRIKSAGQYDALDRLEHDFNNVRFAWITALKQQEVSALDGALDALFWFSMMRTHYYDGEDLIERVQTLSDDADAAHVLRARARLRRYWMERWRRGAFNEPERVVSELETMLPLFQTAQRQHDIAVCLLVLGDASRYSELHHHDARQHLSQSLERFRELRDNFYAAWALHFMGRHALMTEGLAQAIQFQQESLNLRERCGDLNGVLYAQFNLSDYFLQMGDFDHSAGLSQQMLEHSRETGERSSELMATALLGLTAFLQADFARAAALSDQVSIAAEALNHPLGRTYALLIQSFSAIVHGEPNAAIETLRSLSSSRLHGVVSYWFNLALAMAQSMRKAQDSLQNHIHDALRYTVTVQGAGVMAWCLPVSALIAAQAGDLARSASLIGLSDTLKLADWANAWSTFTDLRAKLEQQLGTDAYEKAIAEGQVFDLAAILEMLLQASTVNRIDSALFSSHVITANRALDEPLSDRELEVLAWIAQGLQNAEIAERLVVEMSTIKKHVSHVYGKLGVTTRAQAILKAQQLGLV